MTPETFESVVVLYRFLLIFPLAIAVALVGFAAGFKAKKLWAKERVLGDADAASFLSFLKWVCLLAAFGVAPIAALCTLPIAIRTVFELLGVLP